MTFGLRALEDCNVIVDVFGLEEGVRWKELDFSWQNMWVAASFLMTASVL